MHTFRNITTDRLRLLGIRASFSIPVCGVLAVTGQSGAGKTSLLRGLLGLDPIRSGTIDSANATLNFDTRSLGARNAAWLKANVRGCLQHVGLWPHLSVEKNLQMTWGNRQRRDGAVYGELLARLGVAHTLDRMPVQLSGGERKRVGLLRMLACPAPLYCIDEIDSGLDNERKVDVAKIINEFSKRAAFVAITHDPAFGEMLDGRVAGWDEIVAESNRRS